MTKNYFISISKSFLIFLIMLTQHYDSGQTALFGASAAEIDVKSTNRPTVQRNPPPRLRLSKCCHLNEHLDMQRNCVPGNSKNWVPHIFFPKNRVYYEPRGESPKYITFKENSLPLIDTNTTNQQPLDATNQLVGCMFADELEHLTGANQIILFGNGSIWLRERGITVEPRQYCIDNDAALVCFPRKSDEMRHPLLKIRKCCSKQSAYDNIAKNCQLMLETDTERLKLPLNESNYQTIYGFPACEQASSSYAIAGDWHLEQLNSTDGSLQVQQKRFVANDYCLEHISADNNSSNTNTKVKIFTCLHHFATGIEDNASVHSSNVSPTGVRTNGAGSTDRIQVAALNIGLVISVVFLAATLIASYMMPSVHHVLHWRCQIFYVFCLFVGDLLLAYTQLTHSLELGSVECSVVASVMHFFFLAAFFWLNTMCFNIWWTFRDFRPSSLERNQELLRLRLYSAYAWGIPMLIALIAACVDLIPDSQLLRPEFGVRSCWFSGEHLSIFAYFFGPVGILLCANIALFISTTHQLTCGLWKREDVKSTTEKTALGKVCLKLVVVMGVTWIADIISWLIGGPQTAWFLTDLINALQGVFIFIVVGCQPQVWAACKRFCCPRSRQEITNTTNGVQHSSSSQGLPSLAACGAEITQNTSIHGGIATTTTSIGCGGNAIVQQQQQHMKIPMETVC